MPVAAIATVGSALIGASSAKKAANAQAKAADASAQVQREIYDDTTAKFAPYLNAGNSALQAYMYEMGLGAAPTVGGSFGATAGGASGGGTPLQITTIQGAPGGGSSEYIPAMAAAGTRYQQQGTGNQYQVGGRTFSTLAEAQNYANQAGGAAAPAQGGTSAYRGFTATPGYQFQLEQGTSAVNALAGARGGLNSGRTMQDLTKFGQGLANTEHSNYLNRLAGLTDMGQASAANQASAGNAYAAGATSAMAQRGNAQAAGYAGVANALQGGIQNGIGLWNYQNNLNAGLKPAGWT